ncbi:MAG TPA: hypothetical protein VHT75_04970 [Acidimicrobiales bacterium]|nr:hypothetical protein [Acidimicrobiales bacterium]
MADFLLVLGVLALVAFTTFVIVLLAVLRKVTRANQVAPGRPSPAPLSWLASPGAPARLHRRLRRAVTTADVSARRIAPAAVALGDVAQEITARAVAVDDGLVAASGLHPMARRGQVAELAAEVRDIEACAARLHRVSGDWRRRHDEAASALSVPPPNLHERLDAVEAALRELPTVTGTPAPQMPQARRPMVTRRAS